MKKNIILFGAGSIGEITAANISKELNIVAFADNDINKHNCYSANGIKIISPYELISAEFDKVVITSSFESQIYKQLLELGIEKEKILSHKCIYSNADRTSIHEKFFHYEHPDVIMTSKTTATHLKHYTEQINYHPMIDFFWEISAISMLSISVLALLRYFAMKTVGRILEIGPYIGGSSIALASGVKKSNKLRIISIEGGSSYLDHPQIPSNDIIGDLKNNISRFDLNNYCKLIRGWSNESHVIEQVFNEIGNDKIGLLFIDANGELERDFSNYGSLLQDNCILVLDDYRDDIDDEKMLLTKRWVDPQINNGNLETLGVFPWGTWFGYLRKNPWKHGKPL